MKHLLNDLSNEEKNNIREQHATREQHTDGLTVMSETFRRLSNAKLGDSKPLINEQTNMPPVTVTAQRKVIPQVTLGTPVTTSKLHLDNMDVAFYPDKTKEGSPSQWTYSVVPVPDPKNDPKNVMIKVTATNPTATVSTTYRCDSKTTIVPIITNRTSRIPKGVSSYKMFTKDGRISQPVTSDVGDINQNFNQMFSTSPTHHLVNFANDASVGSIAGNEDKTAVLPLVTMIKNYCGKNVM